MGTDRSEPRRPSPPGARCGRLVFGDERSQREVHLTTKKPGADETPEKPTKAKPKATRPKLHASHAAPEQRAQKTAQNAPKPRAPRKRAAPGVVAARAGQRAPLRKAPLLAPKRASKRPVAPEAA